MDDNKNKNNVHGDQETSHEKMSVDENDVPMVEVEVRDEVETKKVGRYHPNAPGICELCRRCHENGHRSLPSDLQDLGPFEEQIEGSLPGFMTEQGIYIVRDVVTLNDSMTGKVILPGDFIFTEYDKKPLCGVYVGDLKVVWCQEASDYIVRRFTIQQEALVKTIAIYSEGCRVFGPGVRVRRAEYMVGEKREDWNRVGSDFLIWVATDLAPRQANAEQFTLTLR